MEWYVRVLRWHVRDGAFPHFLSDTAVFHTAMYSVPATALLYSSAHRPYH
eukprot:COSAG01_NODE_52996_length_342_cov_0.913580_1_plen_49_part_10